MNLRKPLPTLGLFLLCIGLMDCAKVTSDKTTPGPTKPSQFEIYQLGTRANRLENYAEAEKYLLQSMAMLEREGKRPGPIFWSALSDSYRMMGRYAEAEEAFGEMLKAEIADHERVLSRERYKKKRDRFEIDREEAQFVGAKIRHHRKSIDRLLEQGRIDAAQTAYDETYEMVEYLVTMPGRIVDSYLAVYGEQLPGFGRAQIRAARGEYAGATRDWESRLPRKIDPGEAGGGNYWEQPNLDRYDIAIILAAGKGKMLERKYDQALELFERLIESAKKRGARMRNSDRMEAFPAAARVEERLGYPKEAEEYYLAYMPLVEESEATRAGDAPFARLKRVTTADALQEFAAFLLRRGRLGEARARFDHSTRLRLETQGPLHPFYGATLICLAEIDAREGDTARARARAREAQEIYDKALAPNAPRKARLYALVAALEALGGEQAIESVPEFARFGEVIERPVGPHYENDALALERFAELLDSADQTESAAALRARSARMHESPR